MSNERMISLDTETTGLNKSKDHIIEIGCVEIVGNIKTGKTFQIYINPPCAVEKAAYEVHGISNEFLSQHKAFSEIAADFLEFIGDAKLIVHNAQFDISFLNRELSLLKIKPIDFTNVIDTLIIARRKYPGSYASLDALCSRFAINNSMRQKHGALVDADLLASVYIAMMFENNVQSNIFTKPQDGKNDVSQNSDHAHRGISKENEKICKVNLSDDDLRLHSELRKGIKNCIWDKIKG